MGQRRVILLNGPSSAGKTTVAHAVRDLRGPGCAVVSIDTLYGAIHPGSRNDWALFRALSGVCFDLAASFARHGHDVIVDTVFEREENLAQAREALGDDLRLVGLSAPVPVLEQREAARRNRPPGWARGQAERVHAHCDYALFLDTSALSVEACAAQVLALFDGARAP